MSGRRRRREPRYTPLPTGADLWPADPEARPSLPEKREPYPEDYDKDLRAPYPEDQDRDVRTPKHAGGRPALPQEAKRQNWNITLSADERAVIEQAAAHAGQPARKWAREMLLQASRQPAARPAPAREETV